MHFALDAPPADAPTTPGSSRDVGHEALERVERGSQAGPHNVVARLNPRTAAPGGGHDRAGGGHRTACTSSTPTTGSAIYGTEDRPTRATTGSQHKGETRCDYAMVPRAVGCHALLAAARAATTGATATAAGEPPRRRRPAGEEHGAGLAVQRGGAGGADAYQTIFDDLINAKPTTTRRRASATSRSSSRSRPRAGTARRGRRAPAGRDPGPGRRGRRSSSLEDLGLDIDELEDTLGDSFVALGAYEGKHYGVPTNINLKSMIWYPKDDFDAAGYNVPETWDELMALSDQIVADGGTPWCVGFESGGATGWPATDWMEDIMLRTAGPEVYDKWVNHEIPFNDPAVSTPASSSATSCSPTATCSAGPTRRRPSPSAMPRRRCSRTRRGAGCTGRRTSSTPSSRRTPRRGSTTTGSPSRRSTRRAPSLAVSSRSSAEREPRPRSSTSSSASSGEEVQCAHGRRAGIVSDLAERQRRDRLLRQPVLADASVVLTTALAEGSGRFDASDLMPAAVGQRQLLDRDGRVHAGRSRRARAQLEDIEASWPS